jgi:hypothetical protein
MSCTVLWAPLHQTPSSLVWKWRRDCFLDYRVFLIKIGRYQNVVYAYPAYCNTRYYAQSMALVSLFSLLLLLPIKIEVIRHFRRYHPWFRHRYFQSPPLSSLVLSSLVSSSPRASSCFAFNSFSSTSLLCFHYFEVGMVMRY